MKKEANANIIIENKLVLQLYVSGMSPKSMEAIENIKRLCDEYLKDAFELEIIDMDGRRIDKILITQVTKNKQ